MKRLDDAQTTLLKGVGILLIIGHNFQYLVSALPGVNEFRFEPENFAAFIDGVRGNPLALPRLLLAYFGHYAVQIFIFLSGYGLASSFAKRVPTWRDFMVRRFLRLYPSFVLAMIASGETMDFSGLSRKTTDKHSTGGVGDKITLPLAPLVACFGVAVPQLSGMPKLER